MWRRLDTQTFVARPVSRPTVSHLGIRQGIRWKCTREARERASASSHLLSRARWAAAGNERDDEAVQGGSAAARQPLWDGFVYGSSESDAAAGFLDCWGKRHPLDSDGIACFYPSTLVSWRGSVYPSHYR